MRILANENFPLGAVEALRQHGHDVAWIRGDAPGSSDQAVLQRAQADDPILVTVDKDFGELAFRARLPAPSGIILFRISAASPQHVARAAAAAKSSRVTPLPK
jgi:predicted nuclease of predicted toxin-antitoxin system